jgi:hypothetical protein
MLFCVCRECVRLVSFNARLVVGFGVAMIGGALVIHVSGDANLIVLFVLMLVRLTLFSTLCFGGGTYGIL